MARLGVTLTCIYKTTPDARFMLINRKFQHCPCLNVKSNNFVRTLILKNNLLLASYACEESVSICLYTRDRMLKLEQTKDLVIIRTDYYYDIILGVSTTICLFRDEIEQFTRPFVEDLLKWSHVNRTIGIYEIYEHHLESLITAITSESTIKIVKSKMDSFKTAWDEELKSHTPGKNFSWGLVIENINELDERRFA
jgi:hypothetical protein